MFKCHIGTAACFWLELGFQAWPSSSVEEWVLVKDSSLDGPGVLEARISSEVLLLDEPDHRHLAFAEMT